MHPAETPTGVLATSTILLVLILLVLLNSNPGKPPRGTTANDDWDGQLESASLTSFVPGFVSHLRAACRAEEPPAGYSGWRAFITLLATINAARGSPISSSSLRLNSFGHLYPDESPAEVRLTCGSFLFRDTAADFLLGIPFDTS